VGNNPVEIGSTLRQLVGTGVHADRSQPDGDSSILPQGHFHRRVLAPTEPLAIDITPRAEFGLGSRSASPLVGEPTLGLEPRTFRLQEGSSPLTPVISRRQQFGDRSHQQRPTPLVDAISHHDRHHNPLQPARETRLFDVKSAPFGSAHAAILARAAEWGCEPS